MTLYACGSRGSRRLAVCQFQPPADDPAVLLFREWLDLILAEFKPAVQCLVELAKERDPDTTPEIPNDVMQSICEFCILPDNFDELPHFLPVKQ